MKSHQFELEVTWDGGAITPSSDRDVLLRRHTVRHPDKPALLGSAAPAFHGEVDRWNPEDLLVAALAQCHMLTFLFLARREGLTVTSYVDRPVGTLRVHPDGSGEMVEVVLRPKVGCVAGSSVDIDSLHHQASQMCFIARSVNFPVRHEPELVIT